jgi:hypothetical protein
VLTYYLEDGTLGIFEPVQRNSGMPGGAFLERGRVRRPEAPAAAAAAAAGQQQQQQQQPGSPGAAARPGTASGAPPPRLQPAFNKHLQPAAARPRSAQAQQQQQQQAQPIAAAALAARLATGEAARQLFYTDCDLHVGARLHIYGRTFQLTEADEGTLKLMEQRAAEYAHADAARVGGPAPAGAAVHARAAGAPGAATRGLTGAAPGAAQVVPEVSSALRPLAGELVRLLRLQGPQEWVSAEALQVGGWVGSRAQPAACRRARAPAGCAHQMPGCRAADSSTRALLAGGDGAAGVGALAAPGHHLQPGVRRQQPRPRRGAAAGGAVRVRGLAGLGVAGCCGGLLWGHCWGHCWGAETACRSRSPSGPQRWAGPLGWASGPPSLWTP